VRPTKGAGGGLEPSAGRAQVLVPIGRADSQEYLPTNTAESPAQRPGNLPDHYPLPWFGSHGLRLTERLPLAVESSKMSTVAVEAPTPSQRPEGTDVGEEEGSDTQSQPFSRG